jgi:hypothetical protein
VKYPQSTSIILERDPAYVPAAGAAPIPPAGPPPGATGQRGRERRRDARTAAIGQGCGGRREAGIAELGCATRDTVGKLLGKGPGQETYSFQCANGETLWFAASSGIADRLGS